MKKIIIISFIILLFSSTTSFAQNNTNDLVSIKNISCYTGTVYNIPIYGININFKNESEKTISKIDFAVLLFDENGMPAYFLNNSLYPNVIELSNNDKIKPQRTAEGDYGLANFYNVKQAKIILKTIYFEDNTLWINEKFNEMITQEKINSEQKD